MKRRLLSLFGLASVFAVSVCMAEELSAPDSQDETGGETLMQLGSFEFIPPRLVEGGRMRVPRPPDWVGDALSVWFSVGLDGKPDLSELEVLIPAECGPYRIWELPDEFRRTLEAMIGPLQFHPATRGGVPVKERTQMPLSVPIFRHASP